MATGISPAGGITSQNISPQFVTAYSSKRIQEYLYDLSIFKIVKRADTKSAIVQDTKAPIIQDISDEFTQDRTKSKKARITRFGKYGVSTFTEGGKIETQSVPTDFVDLEINKIDYIADKVSQFAKNRFNIPYISGMAQRMANALNNKVEGDVLGLSALLSGSDEFIGSGNADILTFEDFYDINEIFRSRGFDTVQEPPICIINLKQEKYLLKQNDEWTKLGELGIDYYQRGRIKGMIGGCYVVSSNMVPLDGSGGARGMALCGADALAMAIGMAPETSTWFEEKEKMQYYDMFYEHGEGILDKRRCLGLNFDADAA